MNDYDISSLLPKKHLLLQLLHDDLMTAAENKLPFVNRSVVHLHYGFGF
jgi:hypothetical protein